MTNRTFFDLFGHRLSAGTHARHAGWGVDRLPNLPITRGFVLLVKLGRLRIYIDTQR